MQQEYSQVKRWLGEWSPRHRDLYKSCCIFCSDSSVSPLKYFKNGNNSFGSNLHLLSKNQGQETSFSLAVRDIGWAAILGAGSSPQHIPAVGRTELLVVGGLRPIFSWVQILKELHPQKQRPWNWAGSSQKPVSWGLQKKRGCPWWQTRRVYRSKAAAPESRHWVIAQRYSRLQSKGRFIQGQHLFPHPAPKEASISFSCP